MKATRRYSVNAIGGTSVTLSPMTMNEDDDKGGQPNLFGTGTIVITQGATPDATFWKVARKYRITVEVVDG
jgi:hypothetical protein